MAEANNFENIVRGILDQEIQVLQIGSVRVSPNAKPVNLVIALETRQQAHDLSTKGREFTLMGDFDSALAAFRQSIVLEESLGNYWGIASDLGNMAEIYRQARDYDRAENLLVWLREFDQSLIHEFFARPRDFTEGRREQLKDYYLLFGMHSESLLRIYLATDRAQFASQIAAEMIDSYENTGEREPIIRARDLIEFLKRRSS
jgi:tetratricopeptide (TPR) repeat protein